MKRHNDQKLNEVLREMTNSKKLKPKLHLTKIKTIWKETMGPSINKYTTQISLRRNKLYLTIESGPLKQELSYGKEKLKKMMNEALGEEYIEEVIIY
ncbi:MAG: DUF721 domain-containing protein [Bacteroidota bacterium]